MRFTKSLPSCFLILVCSTVALLVSCAKVEDSDAVTYDLPIRVSDVKALPKAKLELLTALEKKQSLSFKQITSLIASDHAEAYRSRTRDTGLSVQKALQDLEQIAAVSTSQDPHLFKTDYENEIERLNRAPLVYNTSYVTAADPIRKVRLQCYSGTMLNVLLNRVRSGRPEYRDKNWVVIFESGHVLPGYVQLVGSENHLFGLESTNAGKAKVVYGPIKNLTDLRIVDAELFGLVEIFKFDLKDAPAVANAALKLTAQRFGIDKPYLVPSLGFVKASYRADLMNWSPFQFGTPDVTPGDQPRAKMEEKQSTSRSRALGMGRVAPLAIPMPFPKGFGPIEERERNLMMLRHELSAPKDKTVAWARVSFLGQLYFYYYSVVERDWIPVLENPETDRDFRTPKGVPPYDLDHNVQAFNF